MMLKNVRLIGEQDARSLRVIDCETGELIKNITKVELSITPRDGAIAHVTIAMRIKGLDVVANVATLTGESETEPVPTSDPLAAAVAPKKPPVIETILAPRAPWPFPKKIGSDFVPMHPADRSVE